MNELSTTLREERWYSEELKKEVERLQEAFKKKDEGEENFVHKVYFSFSFISCITIMMMMMNVRYIPVFCMLNVKLRLCRVWK